MNWWTKLRKGVENEVKEVWSDDEKALIDWAHNLLIQITPAVKAAASAAVIAAETVPGGAEAKAAAAFTAASATLVAQGLPVIENAIKGAIEIAVANINAPVASVTAV